MDKSRKFSIIPFQMKIPDLLRIVQSSRQRIFPVTDNNRLAGTFRMSDITGMLQSNDGKIQKAGDLITNPLLDIDPQVTIDVAQQIMLSNGVDELLITEETGGLKRIHGILTSGDILMAHNRKLSENKLREFL